MSAVGRVAIIGGGLIGGSLARSLRETGFAATVVVHDRDPAARDEIAALGFADELAPSARDAASGAELVVLAIPVGGFAETADEIAPVLGYGAIVTDTGSTKRSVIADLAPRIPPHAHLVPAHPMAGTEFSGPNAGFAALFAGRWCLIVPPDARTDDAAIRKVEAMWASTGASTERMTPDHHDRVVAAISHLPHLIAFTICGTAEGLAAETGAGVLKFAASGFRDFTRIAASDPTMWRDVFLNNRDALLEMLGRFEADARQMADAIRTGDGPFISERVEHGRKIRRTLIELNQA